MSRHNEMPPVPPANRSHKGTGDNVEVSKDTPRTKAEVNTDEQGDTANIKQNTTNAGFFKGRRVNRAATHSNRRHTGYCKVRSATTRRSVRVFYGSPIGSDRSDK
jgi:hypothetical protein